MKLQLLALLILVSAPFLFASIEQPRYIEPQAVTHYEPVLNAQISEARDVIQWTAYARQWVFNVRPSNTFADEEGEESVHFFGNLVDDASSFASFTWTDTYKTGMIFTANDTFWLEAPFMDRPFDLVMFRTSDVLAEPDRKVADCSVSHHHDLRNMAVEHVEEEEEEVHETGTRAVLTGRAYLDNYWVSSTKNPSWYTTTATKGLLNDVNAIYSRYSLSTWNFVVSGTPIKNSWTTSGQTSNMLNFFQTWANKNGENKKGNSLIWLVGNNVGGLAYVGSACGAYGNLYRVGVAGLANWSRLWTVKTIAHELGHNRGANHDFNNQCSSNQASGCQCSVMSYCFPSASTYGGAVNYFSSKSVNEIKASCK